jgi:hypothetical protein
VKKSLKIEARFSVVNRVFGIVGNGNHYQGREPGATVGREKLGADEVGRSQRGNVGLLLRALGATEAT